MYNVIVLAEQAMSAADAAEVVVAPRRRSRSRGTTTC